MSAVAASSQDRPMHGIVFILLGMTAISINDVLIKALSDGYPLHQMVFVRSAIGIIFSLAFLQFEGGWSLLRTDSPGLHVLRCLAVIIANMTFFAALATLPLADATALFFVAPLVITVLSIPLLGEQVGPKRLAAVFVGFIGVLIMMQPGSVLDGEGPSLWVLMLPIVGACAYALMQIMTRRLGGTTAASALAVYIQGGFIVVSLLFWVVAGDGRYVEGLENESLIFLLRPWRWPDESDLVLFLGLGFAAAIIGYTMSAAYKSASPATIAPFEYVALPLAIFWGWFAFGEWPSLQTGLGSLLILGAGLYVFLRERVKGRPVSSKRPLRRY
ncbi:MAG: DMT family transporter [Neomegalonema sp.]